jgi:hypothetical protein
MDRAVWQSSHEILLDRTMQVKKAVPVDDAMTLDLHDRAGWIGG